MKKLTNKELIKLRDKIWKINDAIYEKTQEMEKLIIHFENNFIDEKE